VRSFVREAGAGEAVVCMHGVPVSCFLYRRLIDELARRGLRGVAFDLPGMGLAARPRDYDYSWTGLGRFAIAAVDALELERFHLVVHDIGGPVGFELAAADPQRILSLTLLNTLVDVERFRRPWMMEPFAHAGIGRVWLASMAPVTFRQLMYQAGIADRRAVPVAEIDAHVELLKRDDGGDAFLKIMRGFERTAEKSRLYASAARSRRAGAPARGPRGDPHRACQALPAGRPSAGGRRAHRRARQGVTTGAVTLPAPRTLRAAPPRQLRPAG
jgi:pimeloyl-ACP methyl ester carboxylesterase